MLYGNPQRLATRTANRKPLYLGTALLVGSVLMGPADFVVGQVLPDVPPGPPGAQTAPNEVNPNPAPDVQDMPEKDLVVRIVEIQGRQMTVIDKDEENKYTISVSPDANVTLNRKPAKLSELKPNDFVRLTLDPEKPKVATVIAAARVIKDTPPSEATIQKTRPAPRPMPDMEVRPNAGGLGVVISDSPGDGILVLDVRRGTPAWNAEIQTGDYVLQLNQKAVVTPDDFLVTIRAHNPNDTVQLVVWRDGKTRKGSVKLTTFEAARDREAIDDRVYIVGETHGDDTVVVKPTPGRTEMLDREPDQTVVIDREPVVVERGERVVVERPVKPVVVEQRGEGQLPENYNDLAQRYRELQQRFDLLEVKLRQLEAKTE